MRQTFARRSILGYCLGAASATLLASTSRSQAATTTFKADLKGSSEVPSNTTSGTGSATVTLDPATNKITWNVTFSGLTGPATAAHIHGPAPAGKNAGVMIWLSEKGKPAASPLTGSGSLTAAQASDLMNGQCYVNVHTAANPGGEIRGQLVKS
ncbi:MAG TPA: CHRD domain-containing protein [Xanthobacteraceae bacterium]|nr:CHRD domain-containing protein [Xanthobacteraceae bacterium]